MTEVPEIFSVLVKENLKSCTAEQIYLKEGIFTSCWSYIPNSVTDVQQMTNEGLTAEISLYNIFWILLPQ